MTHAFGADIGGIRSIDDIRERCFIDELTGCWHWRYALSSGLVPSLWLPDLRVRTTIGVAIALFTTGRKPDKGVVWHRIASCPSHDCCNPEHRKAGTRRTQMLAAKVVRSPETRAKIAATKRASSKYTPQVVAEIRSSSETLAELARRLGMTVSHVQNIRTGRVWKDSVCGASAFTWRPSE